MKPEENGNMLFFKRLLAIALSAALIGPVMPLQARDRKGDKALMLLKVDSEPSAAALATLRAEPALEMVKSIKLPALAKS